jgi:transposase
MGRDVLYSKSMRTTERKPPRSWPEGRRRRAWELHQQGWTQQRIAEALDVTQGAVSQWLKRATMQGVEALRDHPAPGAKPLLSADQQAQLVALLLEGAEAHGFRGEVWTCRRVAQLIKDQFRVSYHPDHVGRLLRQLGWSAQRPTVRATQRDEVAIAAWYTERWPALKKTVRAEGTYVRAIAACGQRCYTTR